MFDTSLTNIKVQKNRSHKISKQIKINFGEYALVCVKEAKMELLHFTFLKKQIKKFFFKKVKSKLQKHNKNYKIWVSLLPNSVFSKKSTNSRMGKGKGLFDRWLFKLRRGFVLVEFSGVSVHKLYKIVHSLNKKFKIKLQIIFKNKIKRLYNIWSNNNKQSIIFEKYRYL